MRAVLFIYVCLFSGISYSQNIKNIDWFLSKYYVLNQFDTLVYFDKHSNQGLWDLSKVQCRFKDGNVYEGKTLNGQSKAGIWSQSGTRFVMDTDTNEVISISSGRFILRTQVKALKNEVIVSGFLYTEFENIIFSIASGSWNNPNSWSCQCVPSANSNVMIKSGHTIIMLSEESGACKELFIELGAVFDCKSQSFTAKAISP